jgi:hypothetical protein
MLVVNGRRKCITAEGCKDFGQSELWTGNTDSLCPLAIDIPIAAIIGDNIHMLICRFSFSEMTTLSSDIPDKNRLFTCTCK